MDGRNARGGSNAPALSLSLTHAVPTAVYSFASTTPFGPTGAGNPFKLSLTVGATAYTAAVYR